MRCTHVVEDHPARREPIDVRRLEVSTARVADLIEPLLIGHDQHDVGARRHDGRLVRPSVVFDRCSARSPSWRGTSATILSGRAYTLAGVLQRRFDVEIWGAQFERYGSRVWAPLRESDIPVHTFEGAPFPRHLSIMEKIASEIDADAIYVSKPRLPSYGLGILAKQARNRPLVLDVDDHELAFFDEDTRPGRACGSEAKGRSRSDAAVRPHVDPSVRTARRCGGCVDGLERRAPSALRRRRRSARPRRAPLRSGPVRPGRDPTRARGERDRPAAPVRRHTTRAQGDRGGAARPRSVGRRPVPRHVVRDARARRAPLRDRRTRAVGARAAVSAVRGSSSRGRRGRSRMCVAGPRASDLALPAAGEGDGRVGDGRPVPGAAGTTAANPGRQGRTPGARRRRRAARTHCVRVRALRRGTRPRAPRPRRVRAGVQLRRGEHRRSPTVRTVVARYRRCSPRLANLVELPRQVFDVDARTGSAPGARTREGSRRSIAPGEQYDVVMFWKQNDTGIYGRRQDMFVKYLARSGPRAVDRALRPTDDTRNPVQDLPERSRWCRPGPARRATDAEASRAPERYRADALPHVRARGEVLAARRLPVAGAVSGVREVGPRPPRHRKPSHDLLGVPHQRRPPGRHRRARSRHRRRRRRRRPSNVHDRGLAALRAVRDRTTPTCSAAATWSSPTASRSRRQC